MVEICSIGSLLERKRTKAKDKYNKAPVYAVTNNRGFVLSSSLHDFDIFSDDTSNYMVVSKNDFAYNPSRLNVGSIAYFKEEGNGLISPMYVVFHADENKILAEYLYIVIKSEFVRNKIDALKEVGARFRFDFNRWDLIKIPIPSLSEQTRIVGILDTFTSAIDNLKEQIAQRRKQYEYYRDQLLDLEGKPGVEMKTLGEVCLKTHNIKWKSEQVDSYYDYIDLSSVIIDLNRITETTKINKENAPSRAQQIVKTGDVLLGTTRPTLKRICQVSVQYNNQICSTGYCIFRAKTEIVLNRWIFHNIGNRKFWDYCEVHQQGAGYPCLSNTDAFAYRIPVPPLEEQQRIVSILDTFEASIQNLEAQLKERQKQYEYYRNKLLTFE